MVEKHVLANGLTVLVRQSSLIPKVSVQLWYRVGSKDETDGSRGMAHLLEHMTFKGTDALSEIDIAEITTKLSGSTNAFTSRDFTGYVFELPTQHWEIALPLLAECMQDCALKPELLNSELKTVVQELKLYRDDHKAMLLDEMMAKIFSGHPYAHPIIGHKKELWQMSSEGLREFYHKFYTPNNAVLVISGDVTVEHAVAHAEQYFGTIPMGQLPTRTSGKIQLTTSRTDLVRSIQQPLAVCAFVVPGASAQKEYELEALNWLLGSGKGSLLYQKLVDELDIALDVDAFTYDLCERSVLCIEFEPKRVEDIDRVIEQIKTVIAQIQADTFADAQLQRACKQAESEFLSLLESAPKQAYLIGKYYLCTGNENYLFDAVQHDFSSLRKEIVALAQYLKPEHMHVGTVLPLAAGQEDAWHQELARADAQDEKILAQRQRHTELEPAKMANEVAPRLPNHFVFPRHTVVLLPNGLRVLLFHNPAVPKIEILLELRSQFFCDPVDKQGLSSFVSALLLEGSQRWTGPQLASEVESLGMTIGTAAGYVALSLLAADLEKALEIIEEIVSRPTFEPKATEKVRELILASIRAHGDEPLEFVDDLARAKVYGAHPYGKQAMGTEQSVNSITREDILRFYKSHISPQGARLCIVGDLNSHHLDKLLGVMTRWQGPEVPAVEFPQLKPVQAETVVHPIARDQVVLAFAGLSVARTDPDYDKLLIFDQILTGSLLGSMSSRLFQLRERTGLFYTIGGSVVAHADKQPGMVMIKTMVSRDDLDAAEREIKQVIATVADTITEDEVAAARNAIINSMVDNFETNRQMAITFLIMDRLQFSPDYFDLRMQQFYRITLEEVREAARKVMDLSKLVTFKVGKI